MTDPATLQVLAASLRGVAEEMGAALVRSAHSANIKERRDCSTALFDPDGRMIAQAEHMPVHLGAMPDAVAAVRALDPRPGAVYVLNDPYTGGTHLPDITLVVGGRRPGPRVLAGPPCGRGRHAAGEHARRGDRADPGGGRHPAGRVDRGHASRPASPTCASPRSGWPTCAPRRHACWSGPSGCAELAGRLGRRRLAEGMDELYRYSERRTRAAIAELPDGSFGAGDVIEGDGIHTDDIPIAVEVRIAGEELTADFAGTAPSRLAM